MTLRSGLTLLAQSVADDAPRLPLAAALNPVQQFERTLCQIEARFGAGRREWVMMELEYPDDALDCAG